VLAEYNAATVLGVETTEYWPTHLPRLSGYQEAPIQRPRSRVAEALTALALTAFCSIFLTHSGDQMWDWFQRQLHLRVPSTWQRCAHAAWRALAGYTRGVILAAAANATLVGIALAVLRVPLVLPLILVEFFFSFVPLIGSPVALAVAALASRGVTTAIIVLALIVA
jgi:predicted PurR-regulated permease PerM